MHLRRLLDRLKGLSARKRVHIPKVVRNIGISALILVIVFIAAGAIYTMLNDSSSSVPVAGSKTTASIDTVTPIAPVQPAANDKEGVAIESLNTPVAIGSPATVAVNTNAGSKCTISMLINNVPTPLGLEPVIADQYGGASWSWTISSSTPLGTWPLKIICLFHSQSAVVEGNITVTRAN